MGNYIRLVHGDPLITLPSTSPELRLEDFMRHGEQERAPGTHYVTGRDTPTSRRRRGEFVLNGVEALIQSLNTDPEEVVGTLDT